MTDEELLLVNCLVYDQGLAEFRGGERDAPKSLGEWADDWLAKHVDQVDGSPDGSYEGGMTYGEFAQVARSVSGSENLSGVMIDDVTQRASVDEQGRRGNQLVLRDPDDGSVTVAFMGTCGNDEWWDDGQGAWAGVTDTPDQGAALEYLNEMADRYGWLSDMRITTTGHSKGGNLASYLAVLRPDLVDQAVSMDGQGFNDAFLLKYQAQIAAQAGNIRTLASSMDFVHIMFATIGDTTHLTGADLPAGRFGDNHSPFSMLETGADGMLTPRPVAEQDSTMHLAQDLMSYLQKFMSAEDFETLAQMAMQLAMKPPEIGIGDIIDMGKLAGQGAGALGVPTVGGVVVGGLLGGPLGAVMAGVAGLLISFAAVDTWAVVSDALQPEYKQMLDNFWVLFGNFARDNGVDDPEELKALLRALFPGWKGGAAGIVTDKVFSDLANVPDLPYSLVVRDFTDETKRMLFGLVDEVTPQNWVEGVVDFLHDLVTRPPETEFMASDQNGHKDYYRRVMDKGDVTRGQVEAIFAAVATEEQAYAARLDVLGEGLAMTVTALDGMRDRLEAQQ